MTIIFSVIVIILIILKYILFLDIILSWLTIFWIKFRPQFVSDIMEPIYKFVKNKIPTTIWPMDFTPIFIIIAIFLLTSLFLPLTGENYQKLIQINNYFL
jgi:uncharacterized protein YggT (Ycf19 family)